MSSATFGTEPLTDQTDTELTVAVTGASGRIGSSFVKKVKDRFNLRLIVEPGSELDDELAACGEVIACDLAELEKLKDAFAGCDAVVHLAADPSPTAIWQSVRDNNITGTYHACVAAKAAGCGRFVYASSIHAVSGHPKQRQVRTDDPVNPGDLYGVSKCFGEAMCRYMAEQEDMSCIAIRIGAFQPREKAQNPDALKLADSFVSHRDLHQLIERCIRAEGVRFAIVHGLSNNPFNRMDITDTQALLGYEPQDDFTAENPALSELDIAEQLNPHSEEGGQKSGIREEL